MGLSSMCSASQEECYCLGASSTHSVGFQSRAVPTLLWCIGSNMQECVSVVSNIGKATMLA